MWCEGCGQGDLFRRMCEWCTRVLCHNCTAHDCTLGDA